MSDVRGATLQGYDVQSVPEIRQLPASSITIDHDEVARHTSDGSRQEDGA